MMKNLQYNTVHDDDDDDDDDPCAVPDDFIELPVVKTSSSSMSTHGRVYRGAQLVNSDHCLVLLTRSICSIRVNFCFRGRDESR